MVSRKIETSADLLPEDVLRATRDSVRALMLIRAYRMRGHLAADLDPFVRDKYLELWDAVQQRREEDR